MTINNKTITTDQLVSDLMKLDFKPEMSYIAYIRKMIFLAEDTNFSVEQSKILAPWLLNFAKTYRDSDDVEVDGAVLSAIRTGASMLSPNSVDCLFPLLEPNHFIDTVLVTVKMIGRIFEAQPPTKINEYENIAKKIYDIAEPLLNKDTPTQEGALIQLSIYALGAMGSSSILQILKKITKKEKWFKQYILHNIKELRNIWTNRKEEVSKQLIELLNEVIQEIDKGNKMGSKISKAEYNEKLRDVEEAKEELLCAKKEFAKIEGNEIVDNCPKCLGTGKTEDGTGDPAHNPYGVMLYCDCPNCEGKGYIEKGEKDEN